jgi:hypothetical protein
MSLSVTSVMAVGASARVVVDRVIGLGGANRSVATPPGAPEKHQIDHRQKKQNKGREGDQASHFHLQFPDAMSTRLNQFEGIAP